jgi:hypothetical protein
MRIRIVLGLVLIFISCYRGFDSDIYHPQEYVGWWMNDSTTVNGVLDGKSVTHYNFGISQSEVHLSTGTSLGDRYECWRVVLTGSYHWIYLYKADIGKVPDMAFKVVQEPTMRKMVVGYCDSIRYYLSK